MARPNKEGLDYFPVDCKMDDKVYMVEVELGLEGFALFIKLLMKIYNENYYIEWTERKAKIFARQNNTTIDIINTLINICSNEGLFNKRLYKKYQILTSNGIQKRYFHSIKNRKNIYVINEYLVNGISNYLDSLVNVDINSINDNINLINNKHNPHSIVKDSIVKKSKEDTLSGKPDLEAPIKYLNEKAKRGFDPKNDSNKNFIKARYNEGRSLDDFKKVIDKKVTNWLADEKMMMYLRPSTLFNKTNFENYLNEPESDPLQKYYKKERKY